MGDPHVLTQPSGCTQQCPPIPTGSISSWRVPLLACCNALLDLTPSGIVGTHYNGYASQPESLQNAATITLVQEKHTQWCSPDVWSWIVLSVPRECLVLQRSPWGTSLLFAVHKLFSGLGYLSKGIALNIGVYSMFFREGVSSASSYTTLVQPPLDHSWTIGYPVGKNSHKWSLHLTIHTYIHMHAHTHTSVQIHIHT